MAVRDPISIQTFVTGMFQQNTYLVRDNATGATALIDCGDGISKRLKKPGTLKDGRLDMLLMTHTHLDHAWDIAAMKREFPKTPIYVGEQELVLLRVLPQQGSMLGLDIELEAAPEPDVLVKDGAEFRLGETSIKTIFTPGHTPGGICYLFDGGHCFVGDMLFEGAIGRTDLPGGDPRLMGPSLMRLMALPDDVRVYSGHGPVTTIGQERRTNPFILALAAGEDVFDRPRAGF
ncbi:MAG: MBL fold metallo-hydrolase [Planctomycetes bacterium]|nr:MBL fold metallo-hydrolase [Planctomycetota bacterium]